jgi:hypothetical protein
MAGSLAGFVVVLGPCSLPLHASDAVPLETGSVEFSYAGSTTLTEAGQSVGRQSATTAGVDWLQRQPLPFEHWYWGAGLSADRYDFSGTNTLGLNRLQDFAAQLSVEYFVGDDAVASVVVHPGLYFEDRPTGADWDIPVEAVTGIPLNSAFNGVVGLLDARFYRRLVPVAGIVWTISPQVRLEAVYPEPALVITGTSQVELRLGGELIGAGFRTDAALHNRAVEYTSYRIGGKLTGKLLRQLSVSAAAGYETGRTFEFLHGPRRVQGGAAPYVGVSFEYAP